MKLITKLTNELGNFLKLIRRKESMNNNVKKETIQMDIPIEQKRVCEKYCATFLPTDDREKIGVAYNAKQGILPINGLRMYPEEGTSGWFIWTGEELSDDPEFFVPYHTVHIEEWLKDITKYLGLAPGWRFLVAGDYVDVWFDETLLNKETDK
ncbi:immunity protein Imm33 domain-containing protein [Planococcus salinarum]|uniref:immunity protein Imm33 domain-containing protein n=2 Tax=Planococcus salinarum TaxID=622695 RepID=UPI001E60787D|nr:hypothetical protein [Planococcus salinarum]